MDAYNNINSDYKKIKDAFRILKKRYGYVTKFNAMQSASKNEAEIMETHGEDTNFVFFTRVESKGKFDAQGNLQKPLYLNWRGNANEIIEIFEEIGFSVNWEGSEEDLIRLNSREYSIDKNEKEVTKDDKEVPKDNKVASKDDKDVTKDKKDVDLVIYLYSIDIDADTEIEIDRFVYDLDDNENTEKFLIIKSVKDKVFSYTAYKGSKEQLWVLLSNRFGMVENKQLSILIDNQVENIPMEEYVDIYTRCLNSKGKEIDTLFEDFDVKVILEFKTNKMSIYKDLLTDLKKVESNKKYSIFEKEIMTSSELKNFSNNFMNEDFNITFNVKSR